MSGVDDPLRLNRGRRVVDVVTVTMTGRDRIVRGSVRLDEVLVPTLSVTSAAVVVFIIAQAIASALVRVRALRAARTSHDPAVTVMVAAL